MKDYIEAIDESGNKEKMEVVCTFNLEGYEMNYIIYRSLDNKNYYIGKYKGENIVDLDLNLTDNEIKLAENILNGVLK